MKIPNFLKDFSGLFSGTDHYFYTIKESRKCYSFLIYFKEVCVLGQLYNFLADIIPHGMIGTIVFSFCDSFLQTAKIIHILFWGPV